MFAYDTLQSSPFQNLVARLAFKGELTFQIRQQTNDRFK